MSSSSKKGKKPKHQNSVAFKHNKGSKKTAKILSLPNQGLCKRCWDKIEWRKKYRKYKPLKAPTKCQNCDKRTVCRAYHVLCDDCARDLGVCGKCRESKEIVSDVETEEDIQRSMVEEQQMIDSMKERERRTYFRKKYRRNRPSGEEDDEEDGEYSEDDEDDHGSGDDRDNDEEDEDKSDDLKEEDSENT